VSGSRAEFNRQAGEIKNSICVRKSVTTTSAPICRLLPFSLFATLGRMSNANSISGQSPISRRNFLAISGALPAALLAPDALANLAPPDETGILTTKKYPIGLELYSVREELAKDLLNTLKTVAQIGYEVVEFYAPYFDWTTAYAKEVRTQMDDLGLRCYSTHNHMGSFAPGDGQAKAIELNQILGSKILVLSSAPGSVRGLDGWKGLCEQLSNASAQLKTHGLRAGFHNHNTEWAPLDGDLRTMDVVAANTPKDFVLQLDVGTCVAAGADPVAWINANPGRVCVLHLKDWAPGAATEEKAYRVLFGEGVCPWKGILAAAEDTGGVEFYLLEQEGSRFSEFETARRCLASWKAMRKPA
jgi:sugar phosphate isomerase/epimerase